MVHFPFLSLSFPLMPFYFLSFHFHSFMQVERFPVPKSLSCKKQSNQASNQKGNPVPRRNTKRRLKWSFLPTSAKNRKGIPSFLLTLANSVHATQKNQITQAPSKGKRMQSLVLKIRNDGIHAFSLLVAAHALATPGSYLVLRSF